MDCLSIRSRARPSGSKEPLRVARRAQVCIPVLAAYLAYRLIESGSLQVLCKREPDGEHRATQVSSLVQDFTCEELAHLSLTFVALESAREPARLLRAASSLSIMWALTWIEPAS